MILPGHVAAAYLAAEYTSANTRSALAASMFPDLIDKPIRWILRLTPNDRIPAHSLVVGALTSLVALRVRGRDYARGWATGYAAHLLCDEINAHLNPGRIYLWWPLKRYAFHRGPTGLDSSLHDFSRASLALEGALSLLGLAVWGRGRWHARKRWSSIAGNRGGLHASR